MPNHCQNRLIVEGDAEAVAAFRDAVKHTDTDGYDGKTRDVPFALEATVPEPPEGDPRRTPSTMHEGGWDWYTWRVANWGTKWDVYGVSLDDGDDPGRLVYCFKSAWAPPLEGIRRVAIAFPQVTLDLVWMEAGMQTYGRCKWRGEELLDESSLEYDVDDYDLDEDTGEVTAVHDDVLRAHVEAHGFGWTA